MLRRDLLLGAAAAASAGLAQASEPDRTLSENWRKQTRLYVKRVQRAIEQRGKDFPKPLSAALTDEILTRVKALQTQGVPVSRIAELFPFETDSVRALVGERGMRVFNVGFYRDGWFFIAGGYDDAPRAYLCNQDGARPLQLEGGARLIGASRDRRSLAALADDLSISLYNADFTLSRARAFSAPKSLVYGGKKLKLNAKPSYVERLLPFNDGRRLLLTGLCGTFLLSADGMEMIDPTLEQLHRDLSQDAQAQLQYDLSPEEKELLRERSDIRLDMAHIDISRDERFIAFGSQDTSHYVLDASLRKIATLDPQSSYPHCAIFNDEVQQIAFNSCHFYNGATLGLNYGAFGGEKTISSGDAGVQSLDAQDRVYAGVPYRDGYIFGDAYGYLRHVSATGETRWRHHVGGTIAAMAINAEATLLAVGCHAGLATLVDLTTAGQNELAIGSGRFLAAQRYIVVNDETAPIRW